MTPTTSRAYVEAAFDETAENFIALKTLAPTLIEAAEKIAASLKDGGKVLFCGNGGSAADAQHLAAELLGRYLAERAPLAAIALNSNSSTVSAIANDYGFDEAFARQITGLGRKGDVLVAISTSGNSANIVRAAEAARESGLTCIGLSGADGGDLAPLCDIALTVPSDKTPRIQEMHIAVGHMICDLVEKKFT